MADEAETVTPELPLETPQEQPAAEAPAAEAAATEAAPVEAPAESAPEAAAAEAEQQDWRDKELRKKHAQLKERDRELERIRKENEDLRVLAQRPKPAAGEEPVVDLPRTTAPAMTQDQVKEAARQLREQERYQENLVSINSTGEKNYGKDWAKALDNLATLGTVEPRTMQAIIGTDDPAKVLYELGKNPAEYQRIMELPEHRQHTEFVKLSLKQAPKAVVSAAPEPVETVRGRVTPSAMPQDSDDDDTWYAKWEAAQAAKRKKSA